MTPTLPPPRKCEAPGCAHEVTPVLGHLNQTVAPMPAAKFECACGNWTRIEPLR